MYNAYLKSTGFTNAQLNGQISRGNWVDFTSHASSSILGSYSLRQVHRIGDMKIEMDDITTRINEQCLHILYYFLENSKTRVFR